MKHVTYLAFIFFFPSFFFCCADKTTYLSYLDNAEELLEEYPDSAFRFLELIVSPELLKEKDFHTYTLLQVQSKHKTRRDISNDTTLFTIKGYYDKSDLEKAANIYWYSGLIYAAQTKYQDALTNYLIAEDMLINQNSGLKAKIQHSIGTLFFRMGDLSESKKRLKWAVEQYEVYDDIKNQIGVYNMIGNCYISENKLDSAHLYYEKCIELIDVIDNYLYRALALGNLSIGYYALEETEKAKQFIYEALTYPISDKEKSKMYNHLAKMNFSDTDSFHYYIDKSLDLSTKEGDIDYLSNIYLLYSIFEEGQQDYEQALEYYRSHVDYLKKAHKKEYENSLNLLQHKFYLKSFEQENMKLLIHRQQLLIASSVVIISLLLSIGYIVRQKRLLEDAEKNVEYLRKISELYNEKEKSLKNIVFRNFNILKKVALLEQYMVTNPTSSKLLKQFTEIVYGQDSMDWEQLYETINSLHNDLFNKIKKEFTDLHEQEFKICCLTVAKLSNTEIGIILNNSPSTIQSRKSYIRKKLGIPNQGNISDFFQEYFKDPFQPEK